ncbi:MAG: hypothetical protein Q4D33_00765 [Prevotellaceae bacterium]|nr:hypothetical protein [Prevotellaceae bacterium]
MSRYNFKQIAWRVIVALILLALLIDRAMMLLEMSNWVKASLRIAIDTIVYGSIVYNMFTHTLVPRSFSYFMNYLRDKDSTLVAVTKYVGLLLAMLFGISGFIYYLDKSQIEQIETDIPATHFIDIFIPTAIMVGGLAVFVLFFAYIKCCAVKVPTDKK